MEIQLYFEAISEGDFLKKSALSFLVKSTPGANNVFLD